jgi:hypothetical protein
MWRLLRRSLRYQLSLWKRGENKENVEAVEEVGHDINSPYGRKKNFSVEKNCPVYNPFLIGSFIFKCTSMSHVM